MTMAINNMLSLMLCAKSWEAEVTIPFLSGSRLTGIPPWQSKGFPSKFGARHSYNGTSQYNEDEDGNSLTLETLFNIEDWKKSPPKYKHLARLVEYKEFIGKVENMTINVFLVKMVYNREVSSVQRTKCSKSNKFLYSQNFPSMKFVCCSVIAGSTPTTPDDIAAGCGFSGLKNFIVIIRQWRGIYTDLPRKMNRMYYGGAIPSNISQKYGPSSMSHSTYVIDCATQFIKEEIGEEESDKDYIAVHFRTDKLLRRKRSFEKLNDTQCIIDTIKVVRNINKATGIKHVLYFADIYAWHYNEIFKAYNFKISRFNNALNTAKCLNHKAVAAQIEMNAAARGTRLVVCGGGSFQQTIIDRYKINKNFPITRLCP